MKTVLKFVAGFLFLASFILSQREDKVIQSDGIALGLFLWMVADSL